MECGDMLDIIHYYFEEDFNHPSQESALRQSSVRENMYKSLYDVEYLYVIKNPQQANKAIYNPEDDYGDVDEPQEIPKPFNPKSQPAKSYVPPTELNPDAVKPFGSILDAPLK
jgi:hypothetical protein